MQKMGLSVWPPELSAERRLDRPSPGVSIRKFGLLDQSLRWPPQDAPVHGTPPPASSRDASNVYLSFTFASYLTLPGPTIRGANVRQDEREWPRIALECCIRNDAMIAGWGAAAGFGANTATPVGQRASSGHLADHQ
jgi:hypothetical protein